MVLLRTLIESQAISQITKALSAPRAQSSLSTPAPFTFLSSIPAPLRGAADSDGDLDEKLS